MEYTFPDPSANAMLTDTVPSQPQTMLPLSRRAQLLKLQQQAAQLEGEEPDLSQLQQFAAAQGKSGQSAMLNALAAQFAGEQFQPVQAQFLKRAMAAQEPMKLGAGMLTPDGKFIKDPFAAQERGMSRLDRLIQSEQGAITAEEAATLRREDALQRERERKDFNERARQDRLAQFAVTNQLRQDMLDLKRSRAGGGGGGGGGGPSGKPPSGYRWAIGGDGTPVLEFIPGGPADPQLKPAAAGSEDERKAAAWFSQADNARTNMMSATKDDPSAAMPTIAERGAAMIPRVGEDLANTMRPQARQRFVQAASSFAEATLRAATGAGVTIDEATQKVRELTPQLGDKPELIKQKLSDQEVYLKSLKIRAGRALPGNAAGNTQPKPTGALSQEEQEELKQLRAKRAAREQGRQ
jgi:hypothetical protein